MLSLVRRLPRQVVHGPGEICHVHGCLGSHPGHLAWASTASRTGCLAAAQQRHPV